MILKRKDLVKRWSITLRTVDRWIRERNVPCHTTMTGRYWFDEKEIEEWEKKMGVHGNKE